MRNSDKVKNWVGMINEAALRPPEGWCNPHRYGSFAPPRGLTDDGSHVQWFIDGEASFDAIATSIEEAKSEVRISNLQSMSVLSSKSENESAKINFINNNEIKIVMLNLNQGLSVYIILKYIRVNCKSEN